MKTKIILSISCFIFSWSIAFTQLDPDYLNQRKLGDDCFAKKDYNCAEKHYTVAKIIKTDDAYCLERIEVCKEAKRKQAVVEKPKKTAVKEVADTKKKNSTEANLTPIIVPEPPKTTYATEPKKTIEEDLFPTERNGKWGYVDKTGKIKLPFNYSSASYFNAGLAHISFSERSHGFIDKSGKMIIPLDSSYVNNDYYFSDGLCSVQLYTSNQNLRNDGMCLTCLDDWGFIDKQGKVVIPFTYELVGDFSEGLAGVSDYHDSWGFIDKSNKIVIPINYKSVGSFKEGLASVKRGNKEGFIDKNNQIIIPFEYENTSYFNEGLADVKKNKKWGFINKSNQVIVPFDYEYVYGFTEGLAKVKKNDKFFYINKQCKCVKDCP